MAEERPERRLMPRVEVLGPAVITAPGLRADCVVRDLSSTGAKLAVSWSIKLPPDFDVTLLKINSVRHVRLKWRDGNFAGVEFGRGEEPAVAPAEVAPPAQATKTVGLKSSWRGRR